MDSIGESSGGRLSRSCVPLGACWAKNFRFECHGVERLREQEALDFVDLRTPVTRRSRL